MNAFEDITKSKQQLPGISQLSIDDFKSHRTNFFKQMSDNSMALFLAASEVTRSNDTEFTFCQNKSFYYLTGFNEPDALLVLITDRSANLGMGWMKLRANIPKVQSHCP